MVRKATSVLCAAVGRLAPPVNGVAVLRVAIFGPPLRVIGEEVTATVIKKESKRAEMPPILVSGGEAERLSRRRRPLKGPTAVGLRPCR